MPLRMPALGRCAILGELALLPPSKSLHPSEDALNRAICEFASATNRITSYRSETKCSRELQAAIIYEFVIGPRSNCSRFIPGDRRCPNRQIGNALREAFACAAAARLSEEYSVGRQSNIIDHAKRLEGHGHLELALDLIYDYVDGLARQDRLDECDIVFTSATPGSLSTDLLLAMLTATLPWKSRLRSRHRFLQSVRATFVARGESEENLLAGLG